MEHLKVLPPIFSLRKGFRQSKGQHWTRKKLKRRFRRIYGAIDYDAPIASEPSKIGLGTKIGVGVAVVVFGLVFALGDFLPSGSVSPDKAAIVAKNTLSPEEKEELQTRLQQYEAALNISPDDRVAR